MKLELNGWVNQNSSVSGEPNKVQRVLSITASAALNPDVLQGNSSVGISFNLPSEAVNAGLVAGAPIKITIETV